MYKLVMIYNKEKIYYHYEIVNEKNEMINNKSIQLIPRKNFKNLNEIFLFINIKGELLTKEEKINIILKSNLINENIKKKIKLYLNL